MKLAMGEFRQFFFSPSVLYIIPCFAFLMPAPLGIPFGKSNIKILKVKKISGS